MFVYFEALRHGSPLSLAHIQEGVACPFSLPGRCSEVRQTDSIGSDSSHGHLSGS